MLKFIQVVSVKTTKKTKHIKYTMVGSDEVHTHTQAQRYDRLFIKMSRLQPGINYIVDARIGWESDNTTAEVWVDWLAPKCWAHLQAIHNDYIRTNDLLAAVVITDNLKEHYDPVTKHPTRSGIMLCKYRKDLHEDPIRITVLGEEFKEQRIAHERRMKHKEKYFKRSRGKTLEQQINSIVDEILANPKKRKWKKTKPKTRPAIIAPTARPRRTRNDWHWNSEELEPSNACKKKKRPPVKK